MNEQSQPEPPQQQPQPKELTEYENALINSPGTAFDNEFIKFIKQLAENKSTKDIVNYINSIEWTDRQKRTIMAYAKIVLGDGLSTTYIGNPRDYRMLYDDKALIDCDLPLGMTRFDITPEFNILLGLISLHFGLESRKSRGALFLRRVGTQSHEIIHEEKSRLKPSGIKEKISGLTSEEY